MRNTLLNYRKSLLLSVFTCFSTLPLLAGTSLPFRQSACDAATYTETSMLTFRESEACEDRAPGPAGNFYISLGVRTMSAPAGTISSRFIDDSPDPDSFRAVKTTGGQTFVYNIEAGADFRLHPKGIFYGRTSLAGFFGGPWGIDFNAGVNARLKFRNFAVAPGVDIAFGIAGSQLGKMENHGKYIEVSGDRFYGKNLTIDWNQLFMGLKPNIVFYLPVKNNIMLRLNAGYYLPLAQDNTLNFNGEDEYGKDKTSNQSIKTTNFTVYRNGTRLTAFPYEQKGFFFGVSVAFKFWRTCSSGRVEPSGTNYDPNNNSGHSTPKYDTTPESRPQPKPKTDKPVNY